jgi:outer membrane receptor protein involved in Fe transport
LLQTETFGARGLFRYGENQTSLKTADTTVPSSYANSFASFLLDVPCNSGRDLPIIFPAYRAYQFFAYINDQWLVTPKLTLNLGLRWELYPPATPAHTAGFSNYDPTTNSLVIAGVGGNPLNVGRDNRYNNFAPRFGWAYRVTDKTVVRGGFGISYSPFPDDSYAYNLLCPARQPSVWQSWPECYQRTGILVT